MKLLNIINIHCKNVKYKMLMSLTLLFILSLSNSTLAKGEMDKNLKSVDTEARADIVYDITTGEILYSKNIHERLYPASTTKILTGLLACEYGNLKDIITFNDDAINLENGSSNLEFVEGEKINLKDALYGLMLKSANEVANQLAYYISEKSGLLYKDATEKKLKEIGAFESSFTSPSGLHKDSHYTTCYDMTLIAKAAYFNETFKKVFTSTTYTIPQTNKFGARTVYNSHKMLYNSSPYRVKSVIGGKTGFTDEASNTLVTFSENDGLNLIAVVFKGDGLPVTYGDTKRLLTYFNNNYKTETFFKKGDVVKTINLLNEKGKLDKTINLTLSEDLVLTVPNDWDSFLEDNKDKDKDNVDIDNVDSKDKDEDKNINNDENDDNDEDNVEDKDKDKDKVESKNNNKDDKDSDEELDNDDDNKQEIFNYENDLFTITIDVPEETSTPFLKDAVLGNIKIKYNDGNEKTISLISLEEGKLEKESFNFTIIYIILFIAASITLIIFVIKYIKLIKEEKEIE